MYVFDWDAASRQRDSESLLTITSNGIQTVIEFQNAIFTSIHGKKKSQKML